MEKIIPTRTQAFELLKEYNSNASLIKHALAVESVMLHFAKIMGEADREKWGVIGLIHDLDYETYPESHCRKVREIPHGKTLAGRVHSCGGKPRVAALYGCGAERKNGKGTLHGR